MRGLETPRADLQQQLSFEQLIADVSAQVVSAPDEAFATTVVEAIGRVVRLFGGDRGGFLRVEVGRGEVYTSYGWYHESLSQRVSGTLNFAEVMPWATRRVVQERQPLVVNTLADIPAEAERDRAAYLAQGIKSNIVIPLVIGGTVRYVFTMGALHREVQWPVSYVPRLQLLGEIIGSTIERRRVAEALRQSESRLSLAVQSANAGPWDLDIATGRIWGAPRTKELYGFAQETEVNIGMVLAIVHPDDVGRVRDRLGQVASSGGEFVDEYRVMLSDGGVRWVNARGRAVSEADGRYRHVTGISIDITESKHAEEALARATADLQRLREQLERENVYLRQEAGQLTGRWPVVAQSPAMRDVMVQVEKVASTDSTVLLFGETGSGKELVASAIHELSPRRPRAMVRVNCAAIPASLIEAELFGREKGAYTGALSRQVGRFEMASGSTIFLDEIGDLPPDTQVKLLRVIQERQIERLGNPRPVAVDLRIIAATNRDLAKDVRDGRFREDLYYRLNVFPIRVPALRERRDDLPLLVDALVDELRGRIGKHVTAVSRASLDRMSRYSWPGNVRELRNVIERAMILAPGPVLDIDVPDGGGGLAPVRVSGMDRESVLEVLHRTGWRIRGRNGAAELLGLKPTTLEARMARLGITRP